MSQTKLVSPQPICRSSHWLAWSSSPHGARFSREIGSEPMVGHSQYGLLPFHNLEAYEEHVRRVRRRLVPPIW